MRTIATDEVAWSVCLSVCLLIALVSPTKTDEPIEMPFGGLTRVRPRNHVLNGGRDPHGKGQSDPFKALTVSAAVFAAKGSFNRQ